jgi:hypothetical protein
MKVAFAGSFAPRLAEPVKAQLALPCEIVVGDEGAIVTQLADVDVLVSGWTEGMIEARSRLIAENIARTARGEPPLNAIDPAR